MWKREKKRLLIVNGRLMTMDPGREADERRSVSRPGWILVEDGRFINVEQGPCPEEIRTECTLILDAGGNTVVPGFFDSHVHMVQTALNALSLDLSQVHSYDELGELIRRTGLQNPERSICGIRLDWQNLKEKAFPTRSVLDRYWNDSPVWINSIDYQTSILNTFALLYYKIPFTVSGVECDEKLLPTGVFRKNANGMLRNNILRATPDFYRTEALEQLIPELLKNGITTVNAMEGGMLYCDKDADFIYERIQNNDYPLDMELFYQTMNLDRIKEMRLKRVGGSLYVDGTFSASTAAISFDYADRPGFCGELHFSQEKLNDFVFECSRQNLQSALYTIGDRAIEMALKAHRYALDRTGNSTLRHRLEHAELPDDDQIGRAVDMGILFSMQPAYELFWGGENRMYQQRLGKYYRKSNPFYEIIRAGGIICGGSDSDVTPAVPLLGIHGAMNHPVEAHRVGLYDAMKMFTYNGAYGVHCESEKGSIAAGKTADLVILDRNIQKLHREEIRNATVRYTVKSGEICYDSGKEES